MQFGAAWGLLRADAFRAKYFRGGTKQNKNKHAKQYKQNLQLLERDGTLGDLEAVLEISCSSCLALLRSFSLVSSGVCVVIS